MCISTISILIGCCGIFFYPSPKWWKSCAQTVPFKFLEKFKLTTDKTSAEYKVNVGLVI